MEKGGKKGKKPREEKVKIKGKKKTILKEVET